MVVGSSGRRLLTDSPTGRDYPVANQDFPEWMWPQRFSPGWLLLSVLFVTMAAAGLLIAFGAIGTDEYGVTAGFIALAWAFACLASVGSTRAGFRSIRRSKRIRLYTSPDHGPGLQIPSTRSGVTALVSMLLCFGTYGAIAAVTQLMGSNTSLLPSGRDSPVDGWTVGIFGIAALILAIIVTLKWRPSVICLHPDGVVRSVPLHRLAGTAVNLFIPWDAITDVIGVSLVAQSNGVITYNPVVKLEVENITPLDGLDPPDHDGEVSIDVYTLAVEPNTFFALVQDLHKNRALRACLARSDAVELLRPPPLLERFRAARAQKTAR